MTIRVAAIEVCHWHSLYDAAYLRHLVAMPDVALVARAGQRRRARRASARPRSATRRSSPTTVRMLAETKPDFVWRWAGTGRWRASPTTCSTAGCRSSWRSRWGSARTRWSRWPRRPRAPRVYARCRSPSATSPSRSAPASCWPPAASARSPTSTSAINRPGPARYPAWDSGVDARPRRGRRRLPAQPGPPRPRHVPAPDRRGRAGDRRPDQQARARPSGRRLRLGAAALGQRHAGHRRGRQWLPARGHRRGVEDRRPRRHPHHEGRRA